MVNILHVAPENYTGVLLDFVKAHRERGNQSRLVTFYPHVNMYDEDLCLRLPLVGYKKYISVIKGLFTDQKALPDRTAFPRKRVPLNRVEKTFFRIRDRIWEPKLRRAFDQHGLWDYDIYHLEGGVGFLRSGRLVQELKKRGKKIVCNYHGLDLRVRGVLSEIDEASDLNLTCEWDLLKLHPDIHYLFLPIDTAQYTPREPHEGKLRIVHSPRSREYKGTNDMIPIVRELEKEYGVEWVLIENRSHAETMAVKATCDIAIDQMVENQEHPEGGTGYGVNSLETLCMGIPTCTNLTPDYEAFIPDHPFVKITRDTLRDELIKLITDHAYRADVGRHSREWVMKRHGHLNVIDRLYALYREHGLVRAD